MKSVLSQWYSPNESELAEFYRAGTIALDANILLSLYRVNGTQRKQIIEALEKVSDRLWVPYQVALEYQRNRLEVAAGVSSAFDSIESIPNGPLQKILDETYTAIRDLAQKTGNTLRDRDIRERVAKEFSNTEAGLKAFMKSRQKDMMESFLSIRKDHTIDFDEVREEDPVRSALDRILHGAVGAPPDETTLTHRRTEANSRIEKLIPPGYKDAKTKSDPTGDCLIWFELLEYAEKSKRRVLFITDDVKEDFYVRIYGRTIGPRIEMVKEMYEKSGQKYHQTTLDSFLRSAIQYLDAEVEEETITTVESARKSNIALGEARRQFGDSLSQGEYARLITLLRNSEDDFSDPNKLANITPDLVARAKGYARDRRDARFYDLLNRFELQRNLSASKDNRDRIKTSLEMRNAAYARLDRLFSEYSIITQEPQAQPLQYHLAFEIADTLRELGKLKRAHRIVSENLDHFFQNDGHGNEQEFMPYIVELQAMLNDIEREINGGSPAVGREF